jgi:hypothetical protein
LFGNDEQLRRWKVKCWFCNFFIQAVQLSLRPRGFIYDIWFISRLKRFQRQVAFRASTHLVQFGNSNSWLGNYFIFHYNFSQTQNAALFAVITGSTLFFTVHLLTFNYLNFSYAFFVSDINFSYNMSVTKLIKCVILDLDGTLLNTGQ